MRRRLVASQVLVALVLASCAGGQPVPVASPSPGVVVTALPASLVPTAAPTIAPTASPTAVETPEGAELPKAHRYNPLGPGRYVVPPWYRIPLSFEVGDGWRAFRDDKALQVNLNRGENEVGNGTLWLCPYAIPTADVDKFVAAIRATPLMTSEDAVAAEVAGLQGEQFDARAADNPAQPGNDTRMPGTIDILAMKLLHSPGITDFAWYTETVEARLRFMFFEVGDETLIVYLEAPPDEFDAFTDLAESVLDTILVYPPA